MSSKQRYDVEQPVLILVRRGRKGRGFIVSPADSNDPIPCSTIQDLGEAVEEILNDPEQARVDVDSQGQPRFSEEPDDFDTEEEEGEADEAGPSQGPTGRSGFAPPPGFDPKDELMFQLAGMGLDKLRDISSWRRPTKNRRGKK